MPEVETAHRAAEEFANKRNLHLERVTWVHHWTSELFSFRIERPTDFHFRSGEFVIIGVIDEEGQPIMRAYSIASPDWEPHLEFLSVKVPDGALTSRLQHLKVGDRILVGRKPTGTLVIDSLNPSSHLVMVGTGTGLAPFLSVLRDPKTLDKFANVIVTHTVRKQEDLAYRKLLEEEIGADAHLGAALAGRFVYYPTVTQGEFHTRGRITDRIRSGQFRRDLGLGSEARQRSRFMICGSIEFNRDMAEILEGWGLTEGTQSAPGDYVVERSFVG